LVGVPAKKARRRCRRPVRDGVSPEAEEAATIRLANLPVDGKPSAAQ